MSTFSEIYFNGNEYKQMWLNGTKIWEKASGGGEIVYPYPNADSVITFRNTSTSSQSITFEVIDDTLPYSINGTSTNSFTFPSSSETQLKFVNLKPCPNNSSVIPINIEQLRIPKLTDLSNLFKNFGYDSNYTYSWQPQYFEFHPNPTNMYQMFSQCCYLTDDMMNQFMPYFPNTSNVTNMYGIFANCLSLTSLNLSNFNTSNVTNMYGIFANCLSLTSLNLSNFNTSNVTTMYQMFFGCNKLTSLNLSNFNTSNVTTMSGMFWACSKLTSLDLSNFDTSNVTTMSYMFYNCPLLTSLDLSNFDTSQVTNMSSMFDSCTSLTSLGLSSFDTSQVTKYTEMFEKVSNCIIYRGYKWTLGTSSTLGSGTYLTFVYPPIKSITLESSLTDTINVSQSQFTIIPTIAPVGYLKSDLEVIYDETYISIDNNKVTLKDGCQGQTLSITYRSKTDNTISDTITFTVSQDLEISMDATIDFTQSTAPTLPDCMTLDGKGSYYFSHGAYTTNVYGLVPNNKGVKSSVAYTRYKFVAPSDGTLKFVNRCSSESNYDYFTIHVNSSTSQPTYSNSANRLVYDSGTTYQSTDHTTTKTVTRGMTYYIHIQYRKDSSGNSGYDKGCLRSIEFTASGSSSSGGNSGSTESATIDFTSSVTLPSYATVENGELKYDSNYKCAKFIYSDYGTEYALIKYVAPKTGNLKINYNNWSYCAYDSFNIKVGTTINSSTSVNSSSSGSSIYSQPYAVTQGNTYYIEFKFTSGDNCKEWTTDCALVYKIVVE